MKEAEFKAEVDGRDSLFAVPEVRHQICEDNLSMTEAELAALRSFIHYMVGEWIIESVIECDSEVITNYDDFRIRINLVAVTSSQIRLAYQSSGGSPLFNLVGSITFSTSAYKENEIEGTKDGNQPISFVDIKDNRANDKIGIHLPDAVECPDGGGRRRGLDIVRISGRKK